MSNIHIRCEECDKVVAVIDEDFIDHLVAVEDHDINGVNEVRCHVAP